MINTLSCQAEDDLTEKFFEKLLIGAIDKNVDYDEIPAARNHKSDTHGQHRFSMPYRPKDAIKDNANPCPSDEEYNANHYGHRHSKPEASQMKTLREHQRCVPPALGQQLRFSPRPDSYQEVVEPALPRQSTDPQGVAELPQQPSRSQTFGNPKGVFKGWQPRS